MGKVSKLVWPVIFVPVMNVGCTLDPGITGVAGVTETNAASVSQCKYITDITATPGVYGELAAQGLKYSHNQVLAQAKDKGANTVVFDQVTPGTDVYKLHAVAYSCP